jgi:hypothetical protein
MNKKLRFLGVALLSLTGTVILWAFDNPMFNQAETGYHNHWLLTPYEMSANPALFQISFHKERVYYQGLTGDRLNFFRRSFDPKRQQDYQLYFFASKQLDTRSMLAASAKYSHQEQLQVSRSLEKYFYDHYFAFTDTTVGNFYYAGPQLWFLYNLSLKERWQLGIQLNYGVERALKDVYTKCETILRNLDLTGGLGYVLDVGHAGLFARYFSYHGQYEAVKELQDALVKTFFGYHVYRDENPRSTNRKNDIREGYEFGAQMAFDRLGINGLGLQLLGSYSAKATNVAVGSTTTPQQRGYWVRSGWRLFAGLKYHSESDLTAGGVGGQLYCEFRQLSDWAKAGSYNVIIIDNQMNIKRLGLDVIARPLKVLAVMGSLALEIVRNNYQEYIHPFAYQEDQQSWSTQLDLQLKVNPVLQLNLKGRYSKLEPYFYWDNRSFDIIGAEIGAEQLFVFGYIGLSCYYENWQPKDFEQNISAFAIALYYWK